MVGNAIAWAGIALGSYGSNLVDHCLPDVAVLCPVRPAKVHLDVATWDHTADRRCREYPTAIEHGRKDLFSDCHAHALDMLNRDHKLGMVLVDQSNHLGQWNVARCNDTLAVEHDIALDDRAWVDSYQHYFTASMLDGFSLV